MAFFRSLAVLSLALGSIAEPYNTFDGPGFPACNNVSAVHDATSVKDIQNIVQNAIQAGQKIRASGKAHMWYDTMCSDDPNTVIVRTENVNNIYDLDLEGGTVMIEAGVTFLQLAEYLHERGASAGYTLVNWNITLAGCVAMGAHRSSIREDSMVAAGVLEMDIFDGNGKLRHLERDDSDDWLAASTSLGLLGVIVRMKFKIYPDFKVYADQKTLDESEVLNGDIYGMIAPYATANFWVSTCFHPHSPLLTLVVVASQEEVPLALLRRHPHQQKRPRRLPEHIFHHQTRSWRHTSHMEHWQGRILIKSPRRGNPFRTMGKP